MTMADPHRDDPKLSDMVWALRAPPRANDRQEGGDHYQGRAMQPWDVIEAWSLDFWEGNCLKYLLRRKPGTSRLLDLEKARHYLDKAIERELEREKKSLCRKEERT